MLVLRITIPRSCQTPSPGAFISIKSSLKQTPFLPPSSSPWSSILFFPPFLSLSLSLSLSSFQHNPKITPKVTINFFSVISHKYMQTPRRIFQEECRKPRFAVWSGRRKKKRTTVHGVNSLSVSLLGPSTACSSINFLFHKNSLKCIHHNSIQNMTDMIYDYLHIPPHFCWIFSSSCFLHLSQVGNFPPQICSWKQRVLETK